MNPRDRLVLAAYDISESRARNRVAALLESCLTRVQESFFEGWMTETAARKLAESCSRHVDQSDSLRFYILPNNSHEHCLSWGFPPGPEANDFLLF
jgi:CRISPR-associated endonuclease Cas2